MRFFLGVVASLLVAALAAVGHASAGSDPDLEPGFPVQTFERAGTYHGGPAVLTLVGNIDADPTLEILASGLSVGTALRLECRRVDGSRAGPLSDPAARPMPALGAALDLGSRLRGLRRRTSDNVFPRRGQRRRRESLPGWPRNEPPITSPRPPSLADVDGERARRDLHRRKQDWSLHAYRANGTVPPGLAWAAATAGRSVHTPAIGDLDGDGDSRDRVRRPVATTPGIFLRAYHRDGSEVAGLPRPDQHGLRPGRHVSGDRRRRRRRRSGDRRS